MKIHPLIYLLICFTVLFESCEQQSSLPTDSSISGGVISSEVISYSAHEMTFKTKFFISGSKELASFTEADIAGSINISSTSENGVLQDLHKINTTASSTFSCAVLVDNLFNILSYNYYDNISNTEIFIRKLNKSMGANNKFLFSVFEDKAEPVTIFGNGFTDNAASLDQLLATRLNDVKKPEIKADSVRLLESLDYMVDYIDRNAPAGNRNIILLASYSCFHLNSTLQARVINKAKSLGISISVVLFTGDVTYYNLNVFNDDIYYRLAYETGGCLYSSHLSNYADDILPLASNLKNIMGKDYYCYEATWKLMPLNQYYTNYFPGFFETNDLQIGLQTGTGYKLFSMPFGILIN